MCFVIRIMYNATHAGSTIVDFIQLLYKYKTTISTLFGLCPRNTQSFILIYYEGY